jgi:hypothetical protein
MAAPEPVAGLHGADCSDLDGARLELICDPLGEMYGQKVVPDT